MRRNGLLSGSPPEACSLPVAMWVSRLLSEIGPAAANATSPARNSETARSQDSAEADPSDPPGSPAPVSVRRRAGGAAGGASVLSASVAGSAGPGTTPMEVSTISSP
ncbi:MAG: hypothetical protein R2789_15440 [Microthrixaceae bacterium]